MTTTSIAQNESEIEEPETVARDGLTPEERKTLAAERAAKFTEAEQKRYQAKKERRQEKKVQRQPAAVVREWMRAKSDSLVIASHYDPEPVVLALLPYLGLSKPFVIYSEFLEVSPLLYGGSIKTLGNGLRGSLCTDSR